MSTVVKEKVEEEHPVSLSHVRQQILTYGDEIHAFMEHVHADVETYKFTVEKHAEGVEVEIHFKALIRTKPVLKP
jgi:hypothetical protein